MTDNKILMVKLFSGRFVNSGMGNGREQYNINENAIINGKYYGVILNAGELYDISLEKIDDAANSNTDMVDDITVIYFEEIEKETCIVAIAENTKVFRKLQTDEAIVKNRVHNYVYNGEHFSENVGYHTVTDVDDMHLLKENYIPIKIPKECGYFFRAQRALSKEEKYRNLRNEIIEKAFDYLNDSEFDLRPEQIYNANVDHDRDSSNEPLSICQSSKGKQISKKPWVSKNALNKANYLCEYDATHKTFTTDKGHPFMEGHHLIRCTLKISQEFMEKFNRNIDTESNIACLCPNCHRRIHYGNITEKKEVIKALYEAKHDELLKNGITLSLDELMEIYNI